MQHGVVAKVFVKLTCSITSPVTVTGAENLTSIFTTSPLVSTLPPEVEVISVTYGGAVLILTPLLIAKLVILSILGKILFTLRCILLPAVYILSVVASNNAVVLG